MPRRGILVLGAPLVVAAVAAAAPPQAISGRVFLDANGNGLLDKGEKGIAGVRVTDGVTFAATADDGAYQIRIRPDIMLPAPGTSTVAVCWPSKTWPTSKRWFRIKDVEDPKNVNFGLRKDPDQSIPFTYLHVTDSHDWRASRYENQHENTNTTLKEAKFILHTGDVSLGSPAHCRNILKWQGLCDMPTFTAVGNHDTDMRYEEDHELHDLSFCGTFVKFLGPLRWSFDYAGVHFAFVDVIGDHREWADFTAAWLAKDLGALKPGTRIVLTYHYPDPRSSKKFLKVLRDHKVELVHAGHNHAYGWWDRYAAPVVTAFARSSGTANVARVDDKQIHVGVFCDGCSRGGHNYRHSRRCPANWRTHILEGSISGLHGKLHEVTDRKLSGNAEPIKVSTDAVYVTAEIHPGEAKTVGIRLGPKDSRLEVSYADAHITVDGARMPTRIPEQDEGTWKLYVFAHKDMLTVWANDCFFIEKPVKFRRADNVVAFAEGGRASLKKLHVQEIKPDAENRNRSYYCSCGHGGLRRNPQ